MFELIAVNRRDVQEQESLRRYNDRAEAVSEAESRRRSEPLKAFYVFIWLSPFCRLLTYSTL